MDGSVGGCGCGGGTGRGKKERKKGGINLALCIHSN